MYEFQLNSFEIDFNPKQDVKNNSFDVMMSIYCFAEISTEVSMLTIELQPGHFQAPVLVV